VLVPSYTNHSVTFFSFLANLCAEITLLMGVLILLWLSGLESILIAGRYGSTRAKSVKINGGGEVACWCRATNHPVTLLGLLSQFVTYEGS
jgi:hypothetical protein